MSTKATGNKKHLTLADRAAIEHGISCGENFTQIAHRINKDSSTISKEIRRHLFRVPHFQNETQRKRSECEHYQNCEKQHICGNQTCNSLCWKCRPKRCSMYCPDFTPRLCDRLKKPPYVCNDCPQIRSCSHDFYFYRANYANDIYSETKSSSRSGINQTPESLEQLDRLVSPLLLLGQPLSHVFYCDPMASWQKGRLEKNHEFIRYIIPKGMTFAGLNQEQVTLITNHINSVARASLNGCTPFELAQLLIDRKLLDLCQLERIPANQVILKPSLLKK